MYSPIFTSLSLLYVMASFKHLRKEEEGGSSIHKVIDKVSSQGMEGKKADGDGGGASGGGGGARGRHA